MCGHSGSHHLVTGVKTIVHGLAVCLVKLQLLSIGASPSLTIAHLYTSQCTQASSVDPSVSTIIFIARSGFCLIGVDVVWLGLFSAVSTRHYHREHEKRIAVLAGWRIRVGR